LGRVEFDGQRPYDPLAIFVFASAAEHAQEARTLVAANDSSFKSIERLNV
jgi:hypothetical protein